MCEAGWGWGQPRAERKGTGLPAGGCGHIPPPFCCAPVSLLKDEQVLILPRVVSPASPGVVRSDFILTSKEELLSSLSIFLEERSDYSSPPRLCLSLAPGSTPDWFMQRLPGWSLLVVC